MKTVEKIWAENIAKSEAIKKYANSRGALFAPVVRRGGAEGGVPGGAGQRLAALQRRQGQGLARHGRHSEALSGATERAMTTTAERLADGDLPRRRAAAPAAQRPARRPRLAGVRRRRADRLDPHGPARGAAHQSVHRARAAARAARPRDDPARRPARRCAAGAAARASSAGRSSRSTGASMRRLARRDRPDPRLHGGAARPRPAVLARLGALRHRLDRAAAGAAAALAGRALGWRDLAFAAAVGIGSGVVIPTSSRSCSWCACPKPERRPCSPDSPTSATPGSAS